MKKKSVLLLGGGVFAAVIVIVACVIALGGSEKYKQLIPATADVVVRLNFADAADRAGLTSKEGKEIVKSWMDELGKGEAKEMAKYLDAPEEIGLRLDHDIYLFGNLKEEFGGMVVEMYKTENFKNFVKDLMKSDGKEVNFSEHDDLTWIDVKGAGGAVAFCDDYLVICVSKNAEAEIVRLGKLSSDEQYVKTNRGKHLKDIDGQMALDLSFGFIPESEMRQVKELTEKIYGSDIDMKDLNVAYGINLQKGRLEMNADCYTENEKMQELMDKAFDAYGKIGGEFIENNAQKLVFWMGMNFCGEKYLKNFGQVFDALPVPADGKAAVEMMKNTLRGIDGDVAMLVDNSPSALQKDFSFDFRAEVKDKNMAKDFTEKLYEMSPQLKSMVSQRDDEYVVTVPLFTKGEPLARYGVKDGDLYITTMKNDEKADKSKLKDWKSEIKDSYVFMYADMTVLNQMFQDMTQSSYIDAETRMAKCGLGMLKDAVCYMTKKNKVTFQLNLTDDDKTLVQALDEIVKAGLR